MRKGVCAHCRGSETQHRLDPDGCWCQRCMAAPERCRNFVVDQGPPPTTRKTRRLAAQPETSRLAYRVAQLRTGSRRKEQWTIIHHAGADGCTDDEVEQITGRSHQSVSATRNSLMEDGLVVDSGMRRKTRYGNDAIVWVVPRIEELEERL